MLLTFKQKIKLSKKQENIIKLTSEEGRILYNYLLEKKNSYYKETSKSLNYYELQKTLKDYKCEYLTFDMKKEVCRNLENNFKSFYELVKRNKSLNPKPPKFRSKNYFFSLHFVQDFIIQGNILKLSNKKEKFIKIPINHNFVDERIKLRNKSKNILKTCKLTKQDNDYFVCITYETEQKQEIETNKLLSIDLGKKNLVTYYDEHTNSACNFNSDYLFKNQKYYDKRIDELKSKRDKKIKFSKNWKKLNKTKRRLEKKKNKQTNLALHKLSKELSKLDRDIIIGDLTNLKSNILSEYKTINRQMQNNWVLKTFVDHLEYKCKKEGRKLTKVNEAWTSKTCYKCGNINYDLTPKDRVYTCDCCHEVIDRDVNGAINILKVYKQKMGDYSTPLDVKTSERYFGNFQNMNQFCINL